MLKSVQRCEEVVLVFVVQGEGYLKSIRLCRSFCAPSPKAAPKIPTGVQGGCNLELNFDVTSFFKRAFGTCHLISSSLVTYSLRWKKEGTVGARSCRSAM